MTWARLDDGITDRPDLLALERGVRLVHIEGIVWSCRHETDGWIPRHVLRKVTDEPDPESAADSLADAGLWREIDGGWAIVGFLDDQISAEDLARQRELAAVRQRRQRQHRAGDHSLCDPRYCQRARQAVTRDATGDQRGESRHPDPTRPDPTEGKGRKGRDGAGGSAGAPPPGHPQKGAPPPDARPRLLHSEDGEVTADSIVGEVW